MQFLHSNTWQLNWADPNQQMPPQPVLDPVTRETVVDEKTEAPVLEQAANFHELALEIMSSRLHDGEDVKYVFTSGEALFIFTALRMVYVEQFSASLCRTVASLPYHNLVTLETDELVVKEQSSAIRGIRFTCCYDFTGELLFLDSEDILTPGMLGEIENLITSKMF